MPWLEMLMLMQQPQRTDQQAAHLEKKMKRNEMKAMQLCAYLYENGKKAVARVLQCANEIMRTEKLYVFSLYRLCIVIILVINSPR